jgi:hypothetical protein
MGNYEDITQQAVTTVVVIVIIIVVVIIICLRCSHCMWVAWQQNLHLASNYRPQFLPMFFFPSV